MNLKRPRRNPGPSPAPAINATRLAPLDTAMDSYLQWREESRTVQESYQEWQTARRTERREAFGRYVMALDREEHAARGYRRVVEQTRA